MIYYNIDNLNKIFNKNRDKNLCKSIFPQKTNIIAYYVFKPLILLNLNLFASMYEKYSVDYRISNGFIEHFIKFILDHINDLNEIIIKENISKNNSLRMTLYEI